MTESLRILLHRLIDYAGLFPPARLSMKASIENFKSYRTGEHAEMLNRFVLPASRLGEFIELFDQAQDASEWELSASVGPDVETDVAGVVEFNRHIFKGGSRSVIRSVEIRAGDAAAIRRCRQLIPASLEAYFEVPWAQNEIDGCIAELAETEAYAKLRMGGETAEMFPSCAEVAHFLAACAFANVPFKCTAGLHHAIRGVYPYIPELNSASASSASLGRSDPSASLGRSEKMHGFLNVFVAAALADKGASEGDLEAVLEEESAAALQFESSGVRWRGYRIGSDELASARSSFCISFGSCSFAEPLDELRQLGLL